MVPRLLANFVSSLDGVVTLRAGSEGRGIRGGRRSDPHPR